MPFLVNELCTAAVAKIIGTETFSLLAFMSVKIICCFPLRTAASASSCIDLIFSLRVIFVIGKQQSIVTASSFPNFSIFLKMLFVTTGLSITKTLS